MSLFLAREWWATKLGSGAEEFDGGALCVANIDNDASGQGGGAHPMSAGFAAGSGVIHA
jgi:hypothetical protein